MRLAWFSLGRVQTSAGSRRNRRRYSAGETPSRRAKDRRMVSGFRNRTGRLSRRSGRVVLRAAAGPFRVSASRRMSRRHPGFPTERAGKVAGLIIARSARVSTRRSESRWSAIQSWSSRRRGREAGAETCELNWAWPPGSPEKEHQPAGDLERHLLAEILGNQGERRSIPP